MLAKLIRVNRELNKDVIDTQVILRIQVASRFS